MRFVLAVLSSVALAACAHGTVPQDTLTNTFTGVVNGVIVLPSSGPSDSGCTELAVFATTADDKGGTMRVGRPSVHQGKGRCSYQISNLPPAVEITIHVEPAAGMTCRDGSSLAFAAQNQDTFSLKDYEGQMRDFRAQCAAAPSSS